MTSPTSSIHAASVGLLLVNLGTPDEPSPKAVRRYLAEFLSDRRVVEFPRILWKPLLHGIILRLRPRRSAHAYQQIWEQDGSPLAAITARQAALLQARLGNSVTVPWAMRYGNPGVAAKIAELQASGCDRVLMAPLYPQYAAATTASVMDAVGTALRQMRCQPATRMLPPYFCDRHYISALAEDYQRQIAALSFKPQVLLLSFHGIPKRSVDLGDPYQGQCLESARLIKLGLGQAIPDLRVEMSFQSRFGPARWLEPYTEDVLTAKARRDAGKRLVIAAPGFAADCLETREELAIRGRAQFLAAGGEHFAVLDCLNAIEAGMTMLEAILAHELAGWI